MSKKSSPASHAARLASGIALVSLARGMKRAAESLEEEKKTAASTPGTVEYEYIFYERAVKDVIAVVSGLLEILRTNAIEVDPSLDARARNILDVMQYALHPEE